MKKPWSISTTVRNPERLRNFLRVLKQLEGQPFDKNNQKKYQILLIKERLYIPNNIPPEFKKYYEDPTIEIPYDEAKKIFYYKNYEDPPMRGRQSVNPLNKLGFAIAREGYGEIKITELGNKFLSSDYDIGEIFFRSLLKLQFPNPLSDEFKEKEGFNIMPFIATMHLIDRVNRKFYNERTKKKGLSRVEFSVFVPTLIRFDQIDEYVEKILKYREEKDKKKYIRNFIEDFYGTENLPDKKINNLFDYGDNTMRYFRLTRFFKISMDPTGKHWRIDLELSREVEIKQLLDIYTGEALKFNSNEEYLNYISDIKKPSLPWERRDKLEKIASSLKEKIYYILEESRLKTTEEDKEILSVDIKTLSEEEIKKHISNLRSLNIQIKERIQKIELKDNVEKIKEIISILQDDKKIKKYEPEQFEKLVTEALKILNDEISIKPNYPVDDDGEPISHSPGNKPDIECYYSTFNAICEVTLNTSNHQWMEEGQPVMRHLRDFENQNSNKDALCIFIAPKIHRDTYSQFWISVKHEYDGSKQKIVPMTTKQFAALLEVLLYNLEKGKKITHGELYELYSRVINETVKLNAFSQWEIFIENAIKEWQDKIKQYET